MARSDYQGQEVVGVALTLDRGAWGKVSFRIGLDEGEAAVKRLAPTTCFFWDGGHEYQRTLFRRTAEV